MTLRARLRVWAEELIEELQALYLATRDRRTPWYAKALAMAVVGYAVSPIDLIPDPIPVLGYLDDLLLLPFGIAAVRALIPETVLVDCRRRVAAGEARDLPGGRLAAALIVILWLAVLGAAVGTCVGWWDRRHGG